MSLSPRERAAQRIQIQRDQERLFQDLLGILDALDHACEHWQRAEQARESRIQTVPSPVKSPRMGLLKRLWRCLRTWLRLRRGRRSLTHSDILDAYTTDATAEVVTSAREGVDMIRRSLLEVLQQRQVVPLEVLGQPFDPERMHALGRQESEEVAENTVVEEVVRGYLWQNRILREAQVMVAVKSNSADDETEP